MEIRRKVYSLAVDENGEARLFSTCDVELVDVRYFSKDEEDEEKEEYIPLEDIKSNRGLGRSLILGGTPGAIGGYIGKKEAEKLDREGADDEEILESSKKKATKAGAIIGGVLGAAGTAYGGPKAAVPAAIVTSGLSALGARLGAKKNTEVRLRKRKERKYSEGNEEDKVYLDQIESNRGLGRSLVFGGPAGAIGGYIGKKEAEKLDREGKSDREIKDEATMKAAKTGAIINGALGAASGARFGGISGAVYGGVTGAVAGGLGAGLGANKNIRDRLKKRVVRERWNKNLKKRK